ncbi:MAG: peptidoglycan DD-metalloendopeptidase family protein, partial [Chitinophagaceae bacterium]|nr:peptidoglycan DD-metalloendopeptidase family protein [Anaerolineae bacterium]
TLSGSTTPIEKPVSGVAYGVEQIIKPGETGFKSGTYTGRQEFQTFEGTWGWQVFYKPTETQTAKTWAEWKANLTESGVYQISVFVPARHATARQARYKIHGVRGTTTEVIVDINQAVHRNEWVPLGLFDLVKDTPNAGKVFLNDVTGETDREIAFDAIRVRRLLAMPTSVAPAPNPQPNVTNTPEVVGGIFVADGFDAPIGTTEQRRGSRVWPSGWLDASPYGRLYFIGTPREAYHTGADLNFGAPYADLGLPVYAAASGVVTFAARLRVWGNVIVIRHDPLRTNTGRVFYTRYGHVQSMGMEVGQRVNRGQQIAEVGNAFGTYVPHLHFDVSPTSRLEARPDDWPGRDFSGIRRDYLDPATFIQENRP